MFRRSFRSTRDAGTGAQRDSTTTAMDTQHRVDKSARLTKKSTGPSRNPKKLARLQHSFPDAKALITPTSSSTIPSSTPSSIITLTVGRHGRLFAAHENVLRRAPFFDRALRPDHVTIRHDDSTVSSRRITLLEEEPEVFSAVLEYLYKGDYYPRLLHNKDRNSWELENSLSRRGTPQATPVINQPSSLGDRAASGGSAQGLAFLPTPPQTSEAVQPTVFLSSIGQYVLRDTVIYCAAERYGLDELKRIALRKQGLQSSIDVGTILRSAQYCYAHTPDSDSRLRAHYLALIIRCRTTFKRSGTMQAEMEMCGNEVYGKGASKLFFDLFVAMCNHLDDVIEASNAHTPRTI